MKLTLLGLLIAMVCGMTQALPATESPSSGNAAPQQVLIECVVLERSLNGPQNLIPGMDTTGRGGGQLDGFCYSAKPGEELNSLVAALSRDRHVKILQRPRIQTSHGVEADLFVGETRPYPSLLAKTNSAAHEPVLIGVNLRVMPLIQPGNLIAMDLGFQIDRFKENVKIKNVGLVPVATSTKGRAKIQVRDRETVVLGGLLREAVSKAESFLRSPKEISISGVLASRSVNRPVRSELILLVRPTLVVSSNA